MRRQHLLLASAMLISLVATASEATTWQQTSAPVTTQSVGLTRAQALQARIAARRSPGVYAASYQPQTSAQTSGRTQANNTTQSPNRVAINWDEAIADARAQAGQNFTATSRQTFLQPVRPANRAAAGIVSTRLPVLLPTLSALGLEDAPQVMLFPNEDFYTASMQGNGLLVEVFGTRLINLTVAPGARSVRNLLASDNDGFRVERTEYGRELSFNRYGAAYTITIECDEPQTDPRCSEAEFGRNLARSLLIVGGSPDEEG